MGVKLDIPFGVAKEGVQFAERRVRPLVTPCKSPILKVYLLQLTVVECGPEMVDAISVHVSLVHDLVTTK